MGPTADAPTGGDLSVARLVPAQAAAYRTLMLRAYAEHPDAFTSTAEERAALPLSWWAARLDDDPRAGELVLGAFVAGELAGAAGLGFETRVRTRHKATLFGMYVAPGHRRHGLARALVEAVLAQARARPGVEVVQLTVTEGNRAALGLYESVGFRSFGTEPQAVRIGDAYAAKVHMWCALRPAPTRPTG